MSLVTRKPDPSGSQTGSDAPSGRCDTLRASPSAFGITQTCAPESRVETNASVLPSGDQRGWRSDPGPFVNWRDFPVATSASHTRETLRLSWSDGIDTVYATHLPSGESCGSLTLCNAMKSSNRMARFWAKPGSGKSDKGMVRHANNSNDRIQYSGCVRMARTRSSKSLDSGVTLPAASVCTFQAASSFKAVASSYVRCSTRPLEFLLALSSACLSTSGRCLALRTASYCSLVTVRSMR